MDISEYDLALIKITISDDLYNKLMDDMVLFNYTGRKKNDFYTKAIINTYEYITAKDRHERIKTVLTDTLGSKITSSISESKLNLMARKINQKIQGNPYKDKANKHIYIRTTSDPTSQLSQIITENYFQAASVTYRNILQEYIALPQYVRERIIFKNIYETLEKARKNHEKVLIKTDKAERIFDIYDLVRGKEEFHTYVVGYAKDRNDRRYIWSFKLCTIKSASRRGDYYTLTDKENEEAAVKCKQNPAFISGEYKISEVRFTAEGKHLYELLYKDRPRIKEINGDIYTFECSVFQLKNYLKNFGKEAVILNNDETKEELKQFYLDALNAYSD